jgi:hypothetical protein
MTAATQPSIEDVLRGQVHWIPKVNTTLSLLWPMAMSFGSLSIKPRKARWKILF